RLPDELRRVARVVLVAARRVDARDARLPLRREDAVGIAVPPREVAHLGVVERAEMPLVDDDDLVALGRLDAHRREEEMHVQMAVEDAALPRPGLLRPAPARAEADVDDPRAPALPLEAPG